MCVLEEADAHREAACGQSEAIMMHDGDDDDDRGGSKGEGAVRGEGGSSAFFLSSSLSLFQPSRLRLTWTSVVKAVSTTQFL